MPMTKQEIIEELASWAGGLHVAAQRMTNEALREEVLETVTEMIAVVNAQTDTPIWISGMGVPTEEP